MWPFSKKSQPVKPPVDLDTPVTNPRLVAAMDAFMSTQGPEQLDALLLELRRSVYLIVTYMDDAILHKEAATNQATIKKGSTIGILELEGPDGQRTLPLFSDWDAIRKYTQDNVSTMVMPAKQAWSFAAEKYGAAVINPGGPMLPLNRDQVYQLAQSAVPEESE